MYVQDYDGTDFMFQGKSRNVDLEVLKLGRCLVLISKRRLWNNDI